MLFPSCFLRIRVARRLTLAPVSNWPDAAYPMSAFVHDARAYLTYTYNGRVRSSRVESPTSVCSKRVKQTAATARFPKCPGSVDEGVTMSTVVRQKIIRNEASFTPYIVRPVNKSPILAPGALRLITRPTPPGTGIPNELSSLVPGTGKAQPVQPDGGGALLA